MDTDLWMTNNLIADPSLAAVKERLQAEVVRWRMLTEDYNTSPTELVRRTERFTPMPGLPGSGSDNFDGRTGNLNDDTNWTTRLFGNSGADFVLGSDRLDAPPGPFALATLNAANAGTESDWTAVLDTGFFGAGVAAGLVLAYQDTDNFYRFQIQDLRGADTGAWYVRFTRRESGSDTQLWQVDAPSSDDGDAIFIDSTLYRLIVAYAAATDEFSLEVVDVAAPGSPLYSNTVADATFTGGGFGLFANSSGNSGYDNFSLNITGP
jgi:hypothetical protein